LRRFGGGDVLVRAVMRVPRQAADQTEQRGHQTDPGTAAHRDAIPARDQRQGGAQNDQPPSSGAGRPTTGGWYLARRSTRWIPTCGSLPTSGRPTATPTSRSAGSSAATSTGSTAPGVPGGCCHGRRSRTTPGDRPAASPVRPAVTSPTGRTVAVCEWQWREADTVIVLET